MENTVLGFIDIETTGHDPLRSTVNNGCLVMIPWHEIIDIGCVFVRTPGLEILGEFQTLVKTWNPERCDPKTVSITNFPERWANGEWDNAPSLKDAIKMFAGECRKHMGATGVIIPGGQNFFFDWSFLSVAFAYLGIKDEEYATYLHYKKFDVSSMAIQGLWNVEKNLDMSQFSLRTGLLQKALGLQDEPKPHYAINGARQAYAAFKGLSELK